MYSLFDLTWLAYVFLNLIEVSVCSWDLLFFLTILALLYEGGIQNTRIYLQKNVYYMFKLQSPSKYSPFDAVWLSRPFFQCSKQFLNSSILMPFSASAVFCFTPSTLAKRFPVRTFFHPGKQKKVTWGEIG